MASFLQTLLRPDREEEPERAEVAKAANLLQIGEFQLLQLAYLAWFGKELPAAATDHVFRAYMLRSEVPVWARHYARRVLELAEADELDDRDPRYHRYDAEYFKALPLGARRLTWAVCCLAIGLVGIGALSQLATVEATSVLPPYFSAEELSGQPDDEPAAR